MKIMKKENGEQHIFRLYANFELDRNLHVRMAAKNVRARIISLYK